MIFSQPTREAIHRWQELRAKNYQRAQKALAYGYIDHAVCYQELQAYCHEEAIKLMRLEAW